MADVYTKTKRSYVMSKVRSKDSAAEKTVRSLLHKMGYRFRLHRKDLPGSPDIVLPKYNIAIFVHGCFWHQHPRCRKSKRPSTNVDFWNNKLDKNIERDKRNINKLRKLGWKPVIIWECTIKKPNFSSVIDDKIKKLLIR